MSYNAARRTAYVEIPGITDGAGQYPEAEFCYPVGDKSEHTDIRCYGNNQPYKDSYGKGDRVWLMFEDDNPMRPIIVGYRPRQVGNEDKWRQWHYNHIRLEADDRIEGGEIELKTNRLIKLDANPVSDPGGIIEAEAKTKVEFKTHQVFLIECLGDMAGDDGSGADVGVIHLKCKKLLIEAEDGVHVEADEMTVSGDVIAGAEGGDAETGISLLKHKHGGVKSGPSSTGEPQ